MLSALLNLRLHIKRIVLSNVVSLCGFFLVLVSSFILCTVITVSNKPVSAADDKWYSGLFATGVYGGDGDGISTSSRITNGGIPDPHWNYTGVYNSGRVNNVDNPTNGVPVCQDEAYKDESSIGYANTAAVTVFDRSDNVTPPSDSFPSNMTGIGRNATTPTSSGYDTDWVWATRSENTRWISSDKSGKGQQNTFADCPDPTTLVSTGATDDNMNLANIFKFELKDGFKILDEKTDLSTVKLALSADSDNWIRVKVNGHILNNNSNGGWIDPNLRNSKLADFALDMPDANLKVGKDKSNSLTVEVMSTFSNIGFIFDKISLTRVVPTPPSGEAANCRPRVVNVNPGTDGVPKIIPIGVTADWTVEDSASIGRDGSNIYNAYAGGDYYSSGNMPLPAKFSTSYPITLHLRETIGREHWVDPGPYSVCTKTDPETGDCTASYTSDPPPYLTPSSPSNYSIADQTYGACYNYNLKTTTELDSTTNAVEVGSTIGFTTTLTNLKVDRPASGYPHTRSKANEQTQVTKLIFKPGTPLPDKNSKGYISNQSPCDYFRPDRACEKLSEKTYSVVEREAKISLHINDEVDDVLAGSNVCFVYSVKPFSSDSTEDYYYHSNVICHTVYKKPKFQVWGGDLLVGREFGLNKVGDLDYTGNISTSTSVKSGRMYGSWAEYGILPTGTVTGMGSGAAYANSQGLDSYNICNRNRLTFTNSLLIGTNFACSNNSEIGKFQTNQSIPNIELGFPTEAANVLASGSLDLTNINTGIYKTTATSLDVNGGSIGLGKWMVIYAPNAKVTIRGDINYFNGTISNSSQIPQVVIIAGSIDISSNVKNIDSWLITKGDLVTCSEHTTGNLSTKMCENQLKINGPVMAKKILLRRTFGSRVGTDSGEPAEIFNLRADAYIWASNRAKDAGNIQTVYNVELPPRF